MIKTIAMYLPQFHEVEENNCWWGKGFTDWVTVKRAEPLFEGHRQPRVPLNGNYYDLLQYDAMANQAEMAKKYGISGFCFYHYWFKDGKRILEKPAENLLAWTDIDMPFCFSWANETWARTWSNIANSNAWTGEQFEDAEHDKRDDGILLKQSYGGKKEWKEHFDYLLPFFKDPRYLRYENKPIFIIYKPCLMYCLDNMMEYWKELALENGLPGLYIVVTRADRNSWENVDANIQMEFDYTDFEEREIEPDGLCCFEYNAAWEYILKKAYRNKEGGVFYGGFVDVDDTPRRGSKGVAMKNASPQLFRKYYKKLADIAVARHSEYIFVNAWNEWGEGAYLEPDEVFRFGYLEAVRDVMEYVKTAEVTEEDLGREYLETESIAAVQADYYSRALKFERYFKLMDRWVSTFERKEKIENYFADMQMKTIAIYGDGILGKHLNKCLSNSQVYVSYFIDRNSELFRSEDPKKYLKEHFPEAEAVVVTPIMEYKDIRRNLKQIYEVPIISLEEVIFECW